MGEKIMVVGRKQKNIEAILGIPLNIVLKREATFKQIFGDFEEWIFEEGIFKFLLNPINRRWLFWDQVHNDWEDTGYYAGEVEFVWDGEKLLTKKISNPNIFHDHSPLAKMIKVDDSTQKYPIFANTLIGNERNSDIKIEDTDIKALILQHAGGHTLFGMGDKGTILINHKSVPQEGILLHDGDQVTLGKAEFNFINISQDEKPKNTETKQEQKKTQQKHISKLLCNTCHAELHKGQKFCTACGTKVDSEATKQFCPQCGVEIKKGQNFCTGCGVKL